MRNLYGKFCLEYSCIKSGRIHLDGSVSSQKYFLGNWITQDNISFTKLNKIFDNFYGGIFEKNDENIILKDIPVRELWIKKGIIRIIVGIGHVQEDVWICDFKDGFLTQEQLVKEYIRNYLNDVMNEFPHGINEFIEIFESNSYEICDMFNLKDVNPINISEVFKEAFNIMATKND